MARAGRKRKDRLAVAEPAQAATPERMAQRVAIVGTSTVRDQDKNLRPAWQAWDGTLLEALFYRGWISAEGLTAGRRFDALCKRYRAMLLVPKQMFEPSEHQVAMEPDEEAKRFQRTRRDYDDALAAIGRIPSRRIVSDVLAAHICDVGLYERFCVRYGGCQPMVQEAFENLARHYGDV